MGVGLGRWAAGRLLLKGWLVCGTASSKAMKGPARPCCSPDGCLFALWVEASSSSTRSN